MNIALVTGSCGLIGSEAVRFFSQKDHEVVGIDNDLRKYFFGDSGSTSWNKEALKKDISSYKHFQIDIREKNELDKVFNEFGSDIKVIIHTAAQPSHDWAAKEPLTDFSVNANGTLNLLECARQYCPKAVFIFTSTNKVYGDLPNYLPLQELEKRWEIQQGHPYFKGIDESMNIDQSKHSLFGASKVAADILVQEYGRYFQMKTACFRGGCLTGPAHSGAELHGFLSYLVKCFFTGRKYTIFGYLGKQVRDNIHSYDLVHAFYHFYSKPKEAQVYNIGGSRENSCSILEAIDTISEITGKSLDYEISDENRSGDHIWYITDNSKFMSHYPKWKQEFNLTSTLKQIIENSSI